MHAIETLESGPGRHETRRATVAEYNSYTGLFKDMYLASASAGGTEIFIYVVILASYLNVRIIWLMERLAAVWAVA